MSVNKKIKKEVRSWIIMLSIFSVLYFTGWYKQLIIGLQRIVVETGIVRPALNDDLEEAAVVSYDFNLVTQEGKTISFSSLKGKVVFINFWATWCPPCIAEMPDINSLYTSVKNENIVFVMLSRDEDFGKALKFVEKKEFEFPIYQLESTLPQELVSNVIPTTFVLSKDGKIASKKSGFASYDTDDFRNFLVALSQRE